jgi:ankyrin repeat protein
MIKGRTLLHKAAIKGHNTMIKYLIAVGAEVDVRSKVGERLVND